MIITRAPLRVSIGGGGTDLPFYSSKFGGFLTTAAIDKYVYILLEERPFYDTFLIRYSEIETPKKVDEIKHTRIKAALKYLGIENPLEITSVFDVPAGTGLGSSSTFLVALLKALHIYKKEDVSIKRLAEEAAEIEMDILNEPIGKQDQYIAAYGGLLTMKIEKNGNVTTSPLDISYSTSRELENNMLLFSTGVIHSAVEVIKEQKKNMESEEDKLKQMHEIKNIGLEIKKALESGDTTKFGKWLNAHWELKRGFSKNMTSSEIDEIYELGIKNGAIGGKLIGAGGGGFLLFYVEGKKQELREAMEKKGLKELKIKFDFDGCKVVYDGK